MKYKYDELSYQISKKTTQKYSTNFSFGILALHPKIKPSIYAIYGFVRLADEIVDSFLDYNKGKMLQPFKTETFQAVYSNHVFSPIKKLAYFNNGKSNIEKAIKLNSNNLDIRFLRYSIQKKCPTFLGYNNNLEEDKAYLKININQTTSTQLKKMIHNIINSK